MASILLKERTLWLRYGPDAGSSETGFTARGSPRS